MSNNTGRFDGVVDIVKADPNSKRANIIFVSLNTAYRYGITTYIPQSSLNLFDEKERKKIDAINKYLKLTQIEREKLKHELEVAYKQVLEMVIGINYD